jgi:hypothetical protein
MASSLHLNLKGNTIRIVLLFHETEFLILEQI